MTDPVARPPDTRDGRDERDERADRRATVATALVLAALAARVLLVRWDLLFSSPFPLGVDGYFYPIQLRALLETGHLAYPTSPLAFWLMAPLAALTDPILGAKLGAALVGAAATWPAYAVGKRLGASRAAGLAMALVVTTSTGSLHLCADFVKNSFGVTFGLAALAALLAAFERPTRRRLALAALAALLAALAHKTAGAFVALAGVPALGCWLWHHRPAMRRWALTALGASVACLLAVGAFAPSRMVSLPELWRARELLAGPWRWELPALAVGSYRLRLGPEVALTLALCCVAAAVVARGVWRAKRAAPTSAAAMALALLGVIIAWPTLDISDPQGLGFRLRLLAFVPLGASAAVLVSAVARWRPARAPALPAAALAASAALWLTLAPRQLTRGVVRAHPAMISAMVALASALPRDEPVLVSERHLAFMATWYARVAATVHQRPTTTTRWRLMPLTFIGEGTPLSRALAAAREHPSLPAPRGLHPRHPDGLVAVPEETWQWILLQLPPRARAHYARWPSI